MLVMFMLNKRVRNIGKCRRSATYTFGKLCPSTAINARIVSYTGICLYIVLRCHPSYEID